MPPTAVSIVTPEDLFCPIVTPGNLFCPIVTPGDLFSPIVTSGDFFCPIVTPGDLPIFYAKSGRSAMLLYKTLREICSVLLKKREIYNRYLIRGKACFSQEQPEAVRSVRNTPG